MKRLKRKKLKKGVKVKKPKGKLTVKIKDKADKIAKENSIRKTAEFQSYVIWKSLPAMLRGLSEDKLNLLGIDDELSVKMLKIKSQTAFAEEHGLKVATCSEWNKILTDENIIFNNINRWAKAITPNVIMALGKKAIKTGNAPEVLAWGKIVEDLKDKSEVDASEDLKKILEKVSNLLPE